MAIAASITAAAPANIQSWLQRVLASFTPAAPVASAPTIEAIIADLRLLLRRVEHVQREHGRWDTRFLAQVVARTLLAPLGGLQLAPELDRSRYGALHALNPLGAAGERRAASDVEHDLDVATAFLKSAVDEAERLRAG